MYDKFRKFLDYISLIHISKREEFNKSIEDRISGIGYEEYGDLTPLVDEFEHNMFSLDSSKQKAYLSKIVNDLYQSECRFTNHEVRTLLENRSTGNYTESIFNSFVYEMWSLYGSIVDYLYALSFRHGIDFAELQKDMGRELMKEYPKRPYNWDQLGYSFKQQGYEVVEVRELGGAELNVLSKNSNEKKDDSTKAIISTEFEKIKERFTNEKAYKRAIEETVKFYENEKYRAINPIIETQKAKDAVATTYRNIKITTGRINDHTFSGDTDYLEFVKSLYKMYETLTIAQLGKKMESKI